MAGELSGLGALTGANFADGDLFEVDDISDTTMAAGGTNKKTTAGDLYTYVSGRSAAYNAAVATQGPGFATDTYLTGSSIAIPAGRLKAGTIYRCKFDVVKTAAGTATPIISPRFGTAGTTADTARGALTYAAQTGVVDEGLFEIFLTFRSVGSGTAAVIQAVGTLVHRLSITGLSTDVGGTKVATSAGFDSTVANSILGLSVNGGTSASWTIRVVQAELFNLA